MRVFRLPDTRLHFASRVERNIDATGDRRHFLLVDQFARIVVVRIGGLELHGRQQLAVRQVDRVLGGLLPIQRADHRRIFFDADRDRLVEGPRQKLFLRLLIFQIARWMANDPFECATTGLEARFGGIEGRNRCCFPSLGLRHVGACHLAHREPVLRRLELLR